jgi:outer membrane protein TolC
LVRTRNGLLPRLDFFLTLGQTGYSDSFGNAIGRMIGDGYDIQAGASFSYPVRNRRAEALHRRAGLGRDQSVEALDNLARLVEEDVRAAYIEVERAREQIAASAASSRLQEEKLAAETERFRVGTSTAFQVAQAQRDLVSSQIAEVQAVVENLTAIVALFRLEGSLLERRGVAAPGRLPVSE